MRAVAVRNDDCTVVINLFGQSCREEYDFDVVERIVAALQETGHETLLCQGNEYYRHSCLCHTSHPAIVFNSATGMQGERRWPPFRRCSIWPECPTPASVRQPREWNGTRQADRQDADARSRRADSELSRDASRH